MTEVGCPVVQPGVSSLLFNKQLLSEHSGAFPKLRLKLGSVDALLELTVNCPKFSVLFRFIPLYNGTIGLDS